GFLYLSLSGKVAGRSLKMTAASDISTSHDSCSLGNQSLTSNRLFHKLQSAKLQNCPLGLRIGVGGNHQDRHRSLSVLQLEEQVESGLSRHPVVADDEIEVELA